MLTGIHSTSHLYIMWLEHFERNWKKKRWTRRGQSASFLRPDTNQTERREKMKWKNSFGHEVQD